MERPVAKRTKLEYPPIADNALVSGYETNIPPQDFMELKRMDHKEVLEIQATKRHIADEETKRVHKKEDEETRRAHQKEVEETKRAHKKEEEETKREMFTNLSHKL
jgi:hypothetical protein